MTAAEKSKTDSNIIIENIRLGIWNFKIAETSGHMLIQWWRNIEFAVPIIYRLFSDTFTLEPRLFTYFLFWGIWEGVEGALLTHFSSLLLRRVCHN
jgi:hypothetical protein